MAKKKTNASQKNQAKHKANKQAAAKKQVGKKGGQRGR